MRIPLTRAARRVRRWSVLAAVGLLASVLAVQAHAADPLDPVLGDPGRTLPNLVPNTEDLFIADFRHVDDLGNTEPGRFLWFDSRAQNLGDVPLQLTVDEVESAESSTVSQCVSWRASDAHVCRETEPVGGFTWHDEHTHFHYQEFAHYELRHLAANGRPDYSDAGLIAVSDKVSFCLIDSAQVRDDARLTPLYVTCFPTVQGISPGWTDIYSNDLPGQNFSLAGLPDDGRYALIIDLDYDNHLFETDDSDNYLEATIELTNITNPDFAQRHASIVSRYYPAPDDRGTETSTTTTSTTKKPKKPKHENNGKGH